MTRKVTTGMTEINGCLVPGSALVLALILSMGLHLQYYHITSVLSKVRAYAYYILSYVKILTYDSKNKIRVLYYVVFEKFNTH